ncbi:MAG: hypothetical protein Q4G46_12195, partial [Propionibacteriaceae bacterium]|nr:hypothetical protein [Propionibacteriaceae bacterium]
LVLAVSVPAAPGESGESDFGEVTRPPVRWRDVQAVFRDDPGSAATVGAYADTARGRTLADLWTDEATHDFLAEHDLLWFDPTELDQALDELPEPSTPPVNGD